MFALPNHYESADLHAVWDSVIYQYHKSPPLPFTPETWAENGAIARDLLSRYANYTFTTALDIDMWASESHNVGKLAYTGVVQNEKLSDAYIKTNIPVLEQQIVKGGVRLAKLLEHIFAERAIEAAFLQ